MTNENFCGKERKDAKIGRSKLVGALYMSCAPQHQVADMELGEGCATI